MQVDFSPIQRQLSCQQDHHKEVCHSFPVFNLDACYYTPAFVLEVDKVTPLSCRKNMCLMETHTKLYTSPRRKSFPKKSQTLYFIIYLVRAKAIKIQQFLLHLQDHLRGLPHRTIPLMFSMSRIQSISNSCVDHNTHDPSPICALSTKGQKLKLLLPAIKNVEGRLKNAGRWAAWQRDT